MKQTIFALAALVLVGAVGTGIAVSGGQTVRDPENPAFAGNTIASSATTGTQVVRDPENPYWVGATLASTSGGGSATSGLK